MLDYDDNLVEALSIEDTEVERVAHELYQSEKEKYWKEWEDLTTEEKQDYLNSAREKLRDGDTKTYDDFFRGYYETYTRHFKTPSGDEMVAFGNYGYDG